MYSVFIYKTYLQLLIILDKIIIQYRFKTTTYTRHPVQCLNIPISISNYNFANRTYDIIKTLHLKYHPFTISTQKKMTFI